MPRSDAALDRVHERLVGGGLRRLSHISPCMSHVYASCAIHAAVGAAPVPSMTALGACSRGEPFFTACADLPGREHQSAWLSEAGMTKRAFFARIRSATVNGSGLKGPRPERCTRLTPTSQGAKRIAFIGDSIVREMASALKMSLKILPTVYWAPDLLAYSNSYDALIRRDNIQGNTSFLQGLDLQYGEAVRLWPSLLSENWDAVFVGGLGVHLMLERQHWTGDPEALINGSQEHQISWYYSPQIHHRNVVHGWAKFLSCLSRFMRTPFVFVGAMPLDGGVILLDPPRLWDRFHAFDLATVMARAELEVELDFRRRRKSLHFLRPILLARACPGARCDGMHYGSHYPQYGCFASLSPWCDLLGFFVKCALPSLLRPTPDRVAPDETTGPRMAGATPTCRPPRPHTLR